MQISVKYRLSEAGRKEALRLNLDAKEAQTVILDAPVEALEFVTVSKDGEAQLDLHHRTKFDGWHSLSESCLYLDAPIRDWSHVLDVLAENLKSENDAKAQVKEYNEAKAKRLADEKKARLEDQERRNREFMQYPGIYRFAHWQDEKEGVCVVRKDAEMLCLTGEAAKMAFSNWQRELEAENAKEAALVKALKDWALANGSDRVKAMIEEEFDWVVIAEEEFFKANTPPGFEDPNDVFGDGDNEEGERNKPTLVEIIALREAKRLVTDNPALYAEAKLRWNKVVYSDEDGRRIERFPTLDLTLKAPNGSACLVCKKFDI